MPLDPDIRWPQLVAGLLPRIDVLVTDFLARVRRIPTYDEGVLVPMTVVERDAFVSFEHLVLTLAGTPPLAATGRIGADVGRDRARRGVPLDSLLAAVRLDFGVIWARLRRGANDADQAVLVAHAEDVLQVVEAYSGQVQRGYLEEQAVMARELDEERGALLARLLDGRREEGLVDRVALALDIAPTARLVVAAAPEHDPAGLRRAHRTAQAQGRPAHWSARGGHALLLLPWESDDLGAVFALLDGVPCGLGPLAHGVADLPRCVEVARTVAGVLPERAGPATVRHVWAALAAEALGPVGPVLAEDVLHGLAALPATEAARLVACARAYLRSGSVAACAQELFCHRNTVVNRLRRLREATGLDLAVPQDAALLITALACAPD